MKEISPPTIWSRIKRLIDNLAKKTLETLDKLVNSRNVDEILTNVRCPEKFILSNEHVAKVRQFAEFDTEAPVVNTNRHNNKHGKEMIAKIWEDGTQPADDFEDDERTSGPG